MVGINTAIKTVNGNYEGVWFAVPASRARRFAAELAQFGEGVRQRADNVSKAACL